MQARRGKTRRACFLLGSRRKSQTPRVVVAGESDF